MLSEKDFLAVLDVDGTRLGGGDTAATKVVKGRIRRFVVTDGMDDGELVAVAICFGIAVLL